MKTVAAIGFFLAGLMSIFLPGTFALAAAPAQPVKVLVTTFPIYLFTRNITQGVDSVKVDLMLPSQLGCPHDYALRPQDMRKLASADVLIINGLGLEEFLGAPVAKANSTIKIIDSSSGIKETIKYEEDSKHGHDEHKSHVHEQNHSHKKDHVHDKDDSDHHHDVNPHLYASPRMAAKIVNNIGNELSKLVPGAADTIRKNAQAYSAKLNAISDDFLERGQKFKNKSIIQPHAVFDYLARDFGLKIVGTMQSHGNQPSAAEMRELVAVIRKEKAVALFTEPQYSQKVGNTLAKETGIALASLDPVANGPEDAGIDYYEVIMQENLKTIEKILASAPGHL